jgi:hypothetical protein
MGEEKASIDVMPERGIGIFRMKGIEGLTDRHRCPSICDGIDGPWTIR